MLARRPVLAAKTGGPTETVLDGTTGWLRDVDKLDEWTDVMESVLVWMSAGQLENMGEKGRRRVLEKFSQRTMAEHLDSEIRSAVDMKSRPGMMPSSQMLAGGCLGGVALAALTGALMAYR